MGCGARRRFTRWSGGKPRSSQIRVTVLVATVLSWTRISQSRVDGPHADCRALHASLGDLEDEPLRVVQHLFDVVPAFVALADDLGNLAGD